MSRIDTIDDETPAEKGDGSSFEELVRRHQDRIVRFCIRLFGNREDAEDCAVEAFCRAWIYWHSFNHVESSFLPWLYKIASNVYLDTNKRRVATIPFDDLAERYSETNGREDRVILHILIDEALSRLPENQRQALLLRFAGGLPFEEIAEAMNCPVNTALSYVHRGLAHLKAAIAPAPNPIEALGDAVK